MGLHNLEDWDNMGEPPSQGGEVTNGGESATIPTNAGSDLDTRNDSSSTGSRKIPFAIITIVS